MPAFPQRTPSSPSSHRNDALSISSVISMASHAAKLVQRAPFIKASLALHPDIIGRHDDRENTRAADSDAARRVRRDRAVAVISAAILDPLPVHRHDTHRRATGPGCYNAAVS